MDTITLSGRAFILGDVKIIGVLNVRNSAGTAINIASAFVSVYNKAGTAVIANASMTVSYSTDSTRAKAVYTLATGGANPVSGQGVYRAVYALTFNDGSVYQWEEQITVKSKPF